MKARVSSTESRNGFSATSDAIASSKVPEDNLRLKSTFLER